jgi:hypothetical protein
MNKELYPRGIARWGRADVSERHWESKNLSKKSFKTRLGANI